MAAGSRNFPSDCAAYRELIEETGYQAKRLRKVGKIVPVPGYSTEIITIFRGEGLTRFDPAVNKRLVKSQNKGKKDIDEVIQIKIFTIQQIRRLFQKGLLIDAKSICAFAFCGIL